LSQVPQPETPASRARKAAAHLHALQEEIRRLHKSFWPGDVPTTYTVKQDREGDVTVQFVSTIEPDPASALRGRKPR
jgi:hypothetical protein